MADSTSKSGPPGWLLVAAIVVAFWFGQGNGPTPAPEPNTDPLPSPSAVVVPEGSHVCVVEETGDRASNPYLAVMNRDREFWDKTLPQVFKSSGHWYDIDDPVLDAYADAINQSPPPLPSLVVISPAGKILLDVACPKTNAGVAALLKGK